MTSAVMALFKFPKIVNKIPNAVINKYDAQYGILATVLRATQGVYIVIPMMKTFLAMNVADANRRTKMLLNLQIKSTFFRNSWNRLCLLHKTLCFANAYNNMDEVIFANETFFQNLIWICFCWNWIWFTAKYLPHVKILINRSYSKIKVNWHKNETHNGISWSQTVYCLPHSNSTVEQLTWVAYLKKTNRHINHNKSFVHV